MPEALSERHQVAGLSAQRMWSDLLGGYGIQGEMGSVHLQLSCTWCVGALLLQRLRSCLPLIDAGTLPLRHDYDFSMLVFKRYDGPFEV